MPGVQTAAEGNSGLYVRGNDAGQNLILLNQAPLYAHAHLLGFFSVFNPGQVASFELSKTGGGRIETAMQPATVVVQSREETGVRWGVEGDLGIIASQATVTAPLTDRAALFLSGRRSYTGWLIGALSPKGEDDLNYRLQDYDATLAWQIDDHNKLIVNSHYGDDRTHITYNEGLLGGRLQWYASVSSATLRSELSPTTHMENALYYRPKRPRRSATWDTNTAPVGTSAACNWPQVCNMPTAASARSTSPPTTEGSPTPDGGLATTRTNWRPSWPRRFR